MIEMNMNDRINMPYIHIHMRKTITAVRLSVFLAHIVNTTNCVGPRAAETTCSVTSQWSAFRKSGIEIFDSSPLALSGTSPVEADRSQEVPGTKHGFFGHETYGCFQK